MAVIQKSTEQCALLIVFAIVCGFLASLVDSVRQYNQLVCTPRMLWCTLVIATLFFLFVLSLERVVGLVESGSLKRIETFRVSCGRSSLLGRRRNSLR